jgi:hypothetical protein
MNLAACGTLATRPENRVWFRAIDPQYFLETKLCVAPSRRLNSGFSREGQRHEAELRYHGVTEPSEIELLR